MVTMMVSATPLRAGQVENPEYKAWASFKVGSSRTLTGKTTGGFKTIELQDQAILVEIQNDKVMILHPNGVAQVKPAPLPAKVDEKNAKLVGTETVQAMGKSFKCKVYEMAKISSPNGAKSSQTKKWICDDVPGGIVKVEVSITEPGPSPDLQYHRTETNLLTAFEVK